MLGSIFKRMESRFISSEYWVEANVVRWRTIVHYSQITVCGDSLASLVLIHVYCRVEKLRRKRETIEGGKDHKKWNQSQKKQTLIAGTFELGCCMWLALGHWLRLPLGSRLNYGVIFFIYKFYGLLKHVVFWYSAVDMFFIGKVIHLWGFFVFLASCWLNSSMRILDCIYIHTWW